MKEIIIQSFLEKMSSPSSSNYLSTQNSDISSTFSLRSNLSRSVGSLEGGKQFYKLHSKKKQTQFYFLLKKFD